MNPEKLYICAMCYHEQDSMDRKCDMCQSIRVVLKSVIPPELLKIMQAEIEQANMMYLSEEPNGC